MEESNYKIIIDNFKEKMSRKIIGQSELLDGILTAYIAGGHILLEGVPGLAKTLIVKVFAELSGLVFKRIQFTPDLLPADLIGTLIYQQNMGKFSVRRGPVFANIILADEINRAPAKVQSALLEAMAEGQVTIGETSYPLPEAELDRFLLKLFVPYPSLEQEIGIVNRFSGFADKPPLAAEITNAVITGSDLALLRTAAENIKCSSEITKYIVSLVAATRPAANIKQDAYVQGSYLGYISYGASPRASIAIQKCAKVRALFEGRDFVIPEDVKAVAAPALRHRLKLSYEAAADNLTADDIIEKLLNLVPQP